MWTDKLYCPENEQNKDYCPDDAGKEIKRPIQELEHAPILKIEPLEQENTETNGKTNRALKTALTFAEKFNASP